jgi:PmbA protein
MMAPPGNTAPDLAFVERALERCAARGFDAAQARIADQQLHELQADFGDPALLRTVQDSEVTLVGLLDGKRGTVKLNKKDDAALDAAVEELWGATAASLPDEANAIAEAQAPQSFSFGPHAPDYEHMFANLEELLSYTAATYPTITLGSASVRFTGQADVLANSNGVCFDCTSARYGGSLMFTAREGNDVSSFNYTGFVSEALDVPMQDRGTTDALLRQTTDQVRTQRVPGKFTGDLIITPDALSDFIGFLLQNIANQPLIAGTSIYRDKLGERVAATGLTLRSTPLGLPSGYRYTGDGYVAEDTDIVASGILTSYLVDLYGSRKTGLERARTGGGCYVVDAGNVALDEIIGSTRKGVLITRFSGGRPNEKGDFSGIAKNSYYVADGEVKHPISETMVSGNLAEVLLNIDAISSERADFGHAIYPWVRTTGIGVS